MNKTVLTIVLAATMCVVGCGEDDEGMGGSSGAGGSGGSGGDIGPITWTSSNLEIVPPDTCEFFDTLGETFVMNISGNVMTLEIPDTAFVVATQDYSPSDQTAILTGDATNDTFSPCVAQLNDDLTLTADDPSVSIDQNTTLSVSWFHDEEDISAGACEGLWFVPLPCTGEATLTLTQQ